MGKSVSNVDLRLLRWDTQVGFVMQRHLPEVTWRHAYAQDGDLGLQLEAPDGSGAQAGHTPENGGFLVGQSGPRRLWDRWYCHDSGLDGTGYFTRFAF